ncbi:hypothetical protein ACHBTE_29930 [Streptomyces sp. M41]|uniref:hypothetical protein n=1 Tax=Streptomyces sp. M41 TaxID=3059412 RepID=UPI00374D6B09
MTPETDHAESVRALRQLRRIRTFYAAGALMWAASAAAAGWEDPGGRPMWVSVVLLMVFIGLLSLSSLWLGRQQAAGTDAHAHRAAPRRTATWRRHANA